MLTERHIRRPAALPARIMRTEELDYHLPPACIATHPVEPRDSARLLVYDRTTDRIEHQTVADLPGLLQPTDAIVFNTSAVLPARFVVRRATGGRIEGLAIEPAAADGRIWRCMIKGAARLESGHRLRLEAHDETVGNAFIELVGRVGSEWLVRFDAPAPEVLAEFGRTPLPPYILKARAARGEIHHGIEAARDDDHDREDYQTVYADRSQQGSVAAPTAGLHFTPQLLERLGERGVQRIDVVLHVGPGTFRPVTAERLEGHQMHSEHWSVTGAAIDALRRQRAEGRRIVAVGTTAVRTLESLPEPLPCSEDVPDGLHGSTTLMIAPGYTFRHVDALLTNFHLPRSTLLALVAALVGLDRLKEIYAIAIGEGYRFFSYGDAMLVV